MSELQTAANPKGTPAHTLASSVPAAPSFGDRHYLDRISTRLVEHLDRRAAQDTVTPSGWWGSRFADAVRAPVVNMIFSARYENFSRQAREKLLGPGAVTLADVVSYAYRHGCGDLVRQELLRADVSAAERAMVVSQLSAFEQAAEHTLAQRLTQEKDLAEGFTDNVSKSAPGFLALTAKFPVSLAFSTGMLAYQISRIVLADTKIHEIAHRVFAADSQQELDKVSAQLSGPDLVYESVSSDAVGRTLKMIKGGADLVASDAAIKGGVEAFAQDPQVKSFVDSVRSSASQVLRNRG